MPIEAALVENTVREALRQAEDTAEIIVQLHPDDLALLRAHQADILNGLPDSGPLRFLPSSNVGRGGCIIQTRFGLVDARRETKIEQLRQSLNV
jgi:flagellar assembly protein FliH